MLEMMSYPEMRYPNSEAIFELALQAILADTEEEMMIPVVEGLLDAYHAAVEFEADFARAKDEIPERILFYKNLEKAQEGFAHRFTLTFGKRGWSDWPRSLPEKGVWYPCALVETVAIVLAQRQAARINRANELMREREEDASKV